ncbi:hypothetical protein C2W59_02518 [Bacillus pumilus]|uniref:Uncharacterized protein n=1 Tax=Bacillus pumilus TaxID=1408 RepID=A0AB34QV10_BACPU|nr:hypothetical protein B4127_3848 [Bacillus pumilus]RAP16071.1 hypothetical protein C2W58_01724 [Bacillus pumilus]RAP23672.1 hypothetical protein C2W59_02518 [Bacillus pumilus]
MNKRNGSFFQSSALTPLLFDPASSFTHNKRNNIVYERIE